MSKLIIIDNYDSFTWILYQYFCELGSQAVVFRNDNINITSIERLEPDYLVISPGPGNPDRSGISLDAIRYFAGKIPILGICLGHQAIAQVFGARITQARRIMHGMTSIIKHDSLGVFVGLTRPIRVARYHSLIVEASSMPSCLKISAWSERDGKFDEIMAIRHRYMPLEGIQFHPESIISECGHHLLANFLSCCK